MLFIRGRLSKLLYLSRCSTVAFGRCSTSCFFHWHSRTAQLRLSPRHLPKAKLQLFLYFHFRRRCVNVSKLSTARQMKFIMFNDPAHRAQCLCFRLFTRRYFKLLFSVFHPAALQNNISLARRPVGAAAMMASLFFILSKLSRGT